jgi:hypothetical protein
MAERKEEKKEDRKDEIRMEATLAKRRYLVLTAQFGGKIPGNLRQTL